MTQRSILYKAAKQYLHSQLFRFTEDPARFELTYPVALSPALGECVVTVSTEEKGVFFRAKFPEKAQPEHLAAVAEYITRANCGMKSGGLELDYATGEVWFKNFLRCDAAVPSLSDLQFCNDTCFLMLRRYGDGLVKNMTGAGHPAEDVKEAEKP